MFICLFVCLFVYGFVFFCFNHHGTPTGSFPESFVKIRFDLAEIFGIKKNRKVDWHDGEGEESFFVMV